MSWKHIAGRAKAGGRWILRQTFLPRASVSASPGPQCLSSSHIPWLHDSEPVQSL